MSVYALSDLHGRYDLYQEIKKFLRSEDKVICLGDCGDRGPDSWRTISAVYNDPQFEYLLGNHEHLLACAMLQYLDGEASYYENAIRDCGNNGGYETLKEWIENGTDRNWIKYLLHLSKMETYDNKQGTHIILAHAGLTPNKDNAYSLYELIWDRNHVEEEWPKDERFQNTLIVHGHTPIQLVDKNAQDIIWYRDNHKVNIDCGSVWSDYTCLLDLDTFDERYFGSPK